MSAKQINCKNEGEEEQASSATAINWCMMLKLMLIHSICSNCYWITMCGVARLPGNKLINGIILGLSELSAGIVAGYIISRTSPARAFQICATFAITFNALNQFVVPQDSVLCYITLFIAILGQGGIITCIFVLIYEKIP